jgi:hypothetical protein
LNLSVVKENPSKHEISYQDESPPLTTILGKNRGFYYIHEGKEIYIRDNSYVHEDAPEVFHEEEDFEEQI